jgi:hypothetical protein
VSIFYTPYKPALLDEITGGIISLIGICGLVHDCGWEEIAMLVLLGVWS